MENLIHPYNPNKILLHYERWKQVYQWYEKMEKYGGSQIPLPSPITVSIDPSSRCQMRCFGCNSWKILEKEKTELDLKYLNELAGVLIGWGTKGVCCGGGGESSLNPLLNTFAEILYENDIGVGIVTNGLLLKKLVGRYFKWIGVSVDAGNPEVWAKVHGITNQKLFDTVLEGIEYQVNNGVQVTYKYLVRPDNVNNVLQGMYQANRLKCFAFHLRPMANPWFGDPSKQLFTQQDIETVQGALECGRANFPNLKIFGVFNKLGESWEVVHPFNKCWAIFATCVFQSNKKVGLCCDLRGCPTVEVGPFENPEDFTKFWGSKEHFDIQKKINVKKCSRCTMNILNQVFEKAIIEDGFMENFI